MATSVAQMPGAAEINVAMATAMATDKTEVVVEIVVEIQTVIIGENPYQVTKRVLTDLQTVCAGPIISLGKQPGIAVDHGTVHGPNT